MKDFFVSYNQEDRNWAEWIALTLTQSGYTVTIQAWDFLPGANFVIEMHRATVECSRTLAVLSPDWLAAVFTQPEWAAAFALDPTGVDRKLFPVRVRPCEPPGLLRAIIYCDLVGLAEVDARQTLINAAREAPYRPDAVAFPGVTAQTTPIASHVQLGSDAAAFPGATSTVPVDRLPTLIKCALDLLALLRTTRTTFDAQARLRDDLERRVHERLILNPRQHYEYEEFFARYYSQFNDDETRVFATIRAFTGTVLHDYNCRMLDTIDRCPDLIRYVRSVTQLKDHLLLWLAKFNGVFLSTPTMCLLYAGVEEQVPFPAQIELETWRFLEQQRETEGLLRGEPNPPSEFSEHTSTDSFWRMSLFNKWLLKQLEELEQERRAIAARVDATSAQNKKTLKAIDERLAGILREALSPWMSLDNIVKPEALLSQLRDIARGRTDQWPGDLKAATDAVEATLAHDTGNATFFWTFRDLLPVLPTLAYYARQFGLSNNLETVWQTTRERLTESVISILRTR